MKQVGDLVPGYNEDLFSVLRIAEFDMSNWQLMSKEMRSCVFWHKKQDSMDVYKGDHVESNYLIHPNGGLFPHDIIWWEGYWLDSFCFTEIGTVQDATYMLPEECKEGTYALHMEVR